MVVYEDLQVSFGSPKTYQYNLETLKRKVSKYSIKYKAKFIGANSLGYTGLNYILNVLPSSGITICRKMDQVNAFTIPNSFSCKLG
jgi:hypothetical protein